MSVGKQLLSTMNPWAYITDTLDVSNLPRFSDNDNTNELIWNSVGSTVSIGGLVALGTALAHRMRKRKWDAKENKIIKDKVNTLHPVFTPNYDEDNMEDIEEIRKLGLKKSANGDDEGFVDTLKKVLVGSIPIAVGGTVALTAATAANKVLTSTESKKLDTEISDLRNEIDALHARIIDLNTNKKHSGIRKTASDTLDKSLSTALGALLAVGGPLAYITLYNSMKKSDKYEKIVEAAEDLASENLTNIPQSLSFRLTEGGKAAIDSTEMSYIPELMAAANRRAFKKLEEPKKEEIVDFDDKVSKLKKEDLFA